MPRAPSPLQAELKQVRPFRSPAHEAMVGLAHTADLLRRRYVAIIEPHGITSQQYNVLRILRGAGQEGLPTLTIVERMIEQAPGITRLIDRLEKLGLVSRERSATDRRQVFCRITRAGLTLLARLDAPVEAADNAGMAPLSRAQQQQLIALLNRLRTGVTG